MTRLLLIPLLMVGACSSPAVVEIHTASGDQLRVVTSARLGGRGGTAAAAGAARVVHYDNNEASFRHAAAAAVARGLFSDLARVGSEAVKGATTVRQAEAAAEMEAVRAAGAATAQP